MTDIWPSAEERRILDATRHYSGCGCPGWFLVAEAFGKARAASRFIRFRPRPYPLPEGTARPDIRVIR